MTPHQRETVRDIGGEALVEHTERLITLAREVPHPRFPHKEVMERQRKALVKALGKVGPEVRLLLRTLHGMNARHYGFGGQLPERFDVVRYLEELARVEYAKPKGDPLRQEVLIKTRCVFEVLGVPLESSRSGDLFEYLTVLTESLGAGWDVWQLTRDIAST